MSKAHTSQLQELDTDARLSIPIPLTHKPPGFAFHNIRKTIPPYDLPRHGWLRILPLLLSLQLLLQQSQALRLRISGYFSSKSLLLLMRLLQQLLRLLHLLMLQRT